MRLLAIDAATKTGWAARLDGVITYGSLNVEDGCSRKATRGERMSAAKRAYADLLERTKPDLVMLEAPFGRGYATTRFLYGLAAIVEAAAHEAGAAVIEYEVSAVRLRILGNGKPPGGKADIIAWARQQGYEVSDDQDNEADALVLLHAGFAAQAAPPKPARAARLR